MKKNIIMKSSRINIFLKWNNTKYNSKMKFKKNIIIKWISINITLKWNNIKYNSKMKKKHNYEMN